jgi:hypothetical protein
MTAETHMSVQRGMSAQLAARDGDAALSEFCAPLAPGSRREQAYRRSVNYCTSAVCLLVRRQEGRQFATITDEGLRPTRRALQRPFWFK